MLTNHQFVGKIKVLHFDFLLLSLIDIPPCCSRYARGDFPFLGFRQIFTAWKGVAVLLVI